MQFWQTLIGVIVGGSLTFIGGYVQQWQQRRKEYNQAHLECIRSMYEVLLNTVLFITRLYRYKSSGITVWQTLIDQAQVYHDQSDTLAAQMYMEEPTPEHKHVLSIFIAYREIVGQHPWQKATKDTADRLAVMTDELITAMQVYVRKLERITR